MQLFELDKVQKNPAENSNETFKKILSVSI